MSVEDAKQLYEVIEQDEELQSEFEGLESQDEVIEKLLEIADRQGLEVSRADIEAYAEQQSDELDEEELEDVAGGFWAYWPEHPMARNINE